MKKAAAFAAGAVIIAALVGCQTVKPVLASPAPSSIQVEKSGFSPAGPTGQNSIEISVLYGNSDLISTWKVEVTSAGVIRRTWTGDASSLPPSFTWDGKDDAGTIAPEGTYTARLSLEYKEKYQPASAESRSFVLDVSPPAGSIAVSPAGFTPTDSGVQGPVTLTINATSGVARMDSWTLEVLDPAGAQAKSWSGSWPNVSATWDGSAVGGGFVAPGATYQAVATVRDEYGNSAKITADVLVAALPQKAPATPAAPAKPGQPTITADRLGFSPNGDKVDDTITFALDYGQSSSVVSWKATVSTQAGSPQKTWAGTASSLPATLAWDGKSDSGSLAPEGTYTASIAVDYGTAFTAGSATTPGFILDVTPPTGSITLSSSLFSPIESTDTISLKVNASSPVAKIDSWVMDIYDPGGNIFRTFSDKWPNDTAVWNGRNPAGDLVQSAEDYPVVVTVRDQFGNTGTLKSVVPIDVLVEKTATGYRILASRIFFKAFTADYKDVPADLAAQNAQRLDALAAKLKRFPGYKIRLVGHAVSIYWDNAKLGAQEQKDVLIPLSRARAEAVKAALVERGLDAANLSTEGVGASDQLVPDSNYKDRWQNRRVALFLDK